VVIAPAEVASTMRPLDVRWAVAGGWAIDLWLDRQTRDHHDVEVVVPRSEQMRVRASLGDEWQFSCLDPPGTGWRPWRGHPLRPPAFQLQATSANRAFDVFLEEIDGGVWHYRRNAAQRLPADEVIVASASGIPVIRPEVQLLYMATSNEPKNASDFDVALPHLGSGARTWLRRALETCHPGHRWIGRL
jgi:hypothetical protein